MLQLFLIHPVHFHGLKNYFWLIAVLGAAWHSIVVFVFYRVWGHKYDF